MRKTKFWILGIILALIYSCSDDFGVKEQAPQGIDVSEARAYFEKNATDLAPLTFKNPLSRASSFVVPELIPEWDEAIESENEDYFITEVPLNSPSKVVCVESIAKDNEFLEEEKVICCQRRLVIARQKDKNETDMFIATLHPENEVVGGENASFTGRVFYSELNGDFRKAVEYKNGQVCDTLLITKGYGFAIHTQKGTPLDYSMLAFQEGTTSRSATYSSSESGGGGWWPGSGGGGGPIGGGGTGGGNTGGGSTGGGTGSGGYDQDYMRGRELVDEMMENLRTRNVNAYHTKDVNVLEAAANVTSIGLTVPGIITSCYKFMQGVDLDKVALRFGKAISGLGLAVGLYQTYVAFSEKKYDAEMVMTVVSTVCSALALVFTGWPVVIFGIAVCVVGCISSTMSLALLHPLLIEVPMDDGGRIYVFIPANTSSLA